MKSNYKIKAVFFDVDGTLLSHRHGSVPISAKTAMYRLREIGIKVFAATGRHMLELEQLSVCDLPFDGYVTLNGQICLDVNKNLLYAAPIKDEDTREMASVFDQRKIPVMFIEQDDMYVNFVNTAVADAQAAISSPVPSLGVYTGNKIYQFIVFDREEQVQRLMRKLSGCEMSQWNPYAFDVIPKDGGKVAGIRQILQHVHISREEIMAFGDGENDKDMLRYAGIGVAMGNADASVKQQADHVTADVDQDGVAKALTFYGIL